MRQPDVEHIKEALSSLGWLEGINESLEMLTNINNALQPHPIDKRIKEKQERLLDLQIEKLEKELNK